MASASAQEPVVFLDLQAQRRRLGKRLDRAIAQVLEHGQFIMGPEVAMLEGRLAAFCGCRHAVTCSSGTDALLLALMAWQVGPGDAVFLPAFTFPSTAEVVALLGATPVFVDVDRDTFNIDAGSLSAAVNAVRRNLRPAVVIVVDLFGQPADYRAVAVAAERNGLRVLADAAQSLGGEREGGRVGTLAEVTATSFFPAKPLGCYGDGGAVFTDSDEIAALIRSLRVHGAGATKYDVARLGINGRLDTLQAAVLLEKLVVFEDELASRRRVAARYNDALEDVVEVPRLVEPIVSAWAQYTIRLGCRDEVARALAEAGIPTAVYYPRPLHLQPAYNSFPIAPGGCPVSEEVAGRVLSLPMHPYLEEADQDRVIEAVHLAVR